MAKVIARGRIVNAKGTFTRGDAIEGSEKDLRPLVDSGAARWGDDEGGAWTLSMSPEDYLERYPDGPNADLAREALSDESDEPEDEGE